MPDDVGDVSVPVPDTILTEVVNPVNETNALIQKKETGLRKPPGGAIATEVLEQLDAAFQDNLTDGELQFSRLSIAQPLTPEVGSQEPGWQAGMLFDNVTREIYTTKGYPPWMLAKGIDKDELSKIHFCMYVPITKLPTEYILWKDRKKEGPGFHWKTLDVKDPRVIEGVWGKDGGTWGNTPEQQDTAGKSLPPPVTVNTNFFGMVLDYMDGLAMSSFIVTSFARTSATTGAKFANFLFRHRMQNLPIFGKTYWLYTKSKPHEDTNSTFHISQVTPGPKTSSVNPDLEALLLPTAIKLSDPKTGKEFQERIINASFIEEEGGESSDATATSDNLNATPDF